MKTSVALCTYNGEKFLKEQIDSIINQTKKIDEIVVCDDGSTDSTVSILNDYKNKFPEIFKIYRNEKNLKSVKNFEKAISLCSNEIIFLSDQDDIWLPQKVDEYLNYFEKNSEIEVISSNGFGIDDEGEELDIITIWDVPKFLEEISEEKDYFKMISLVGNIATGASMAIRKKFVKEIIPFPIIEKFHHDEWIALVASYNKKYHLLNEKLFKYRAHDNQQVGGVFFENNSNEKNKLISYFSLSGKDKNFKFYKNFLKRLSNSFQKNDELLGSIYDDKDFFIRNIKYIEDLFYQNKLEMRKKYPFKFFFLNISDKLLGKRQLKK